MQYPGPDCAQISWYWVWKRPRRQVGSESEKECHVVKKWQQMRLLIIDEISMIDAGLFDKIEEVARIVRNNEAVWWDPDCCVWGFLPVAASQQGRQGEVLF